MNMQQFSQFVTRNTFNYSNPITEFFVKMSFKSVLTLVLTLLSLSCIEISGEALTTRAKPVYRCSQSGATCTFSNLRLTSINYQWQPTSYSPYSVRTVKFSGSRTPVVTKEMCESFPSLQYLYLDNLGVTKIDQDAFRNCSNLRLLHLQGNQLDKIDQNTFVHAVNLQELLLHDNQFTHLDENLFSHLNNLQELSMAENNLTEFSPELIRNNRRLSVLYLHSNDLSDLEIEKFLNYLPYLKKLLMNDNEISCTRTYQIYKLLQSKDINFYSPWTSKTRYYSQQYVLGRYTCNPDISWMASNYRKQNALVVRHVNAFYEKIGKMNVTTEFSIISKQIQVSDDKVGKRFDSLEEKFASIDQISEQLEESGVELNETLMKVNEIEEKIKNIDQRLDSIESDIQKLIEFVIRTSSSEKDSPSLSSTDA